MLKKKNLKEKNEDIDIYAKFSIMSKKQMEKSVTALSATSTDLLKLKEGSNLVRFLPKHPKSDRDEFYVDSALHWSLGSDGNKVCSCRRSIERKDCLVCNLVQRLYEALDKKGLSHDSKEYKNLKSSISAISRNRRCYAYVISMSEPKVIKKLAISRQTMADIIDASYEAFDSDVVSDPKEGLVVNIKRTGTGQFDTKYKIYLKDKYKLPPEILSALLKMPPIEDTIIENSDLEIQDLVEETEMKFSGLLDLEKKKKLRKENDNEDNEDEEDDIEEDEEDDIEEDEDDDIEEEEDDDIEEEDDDDVEDEDDDIEEEDDDDIEEEEDDDDVKKLKKKLSKRK